MTATSGAAAYILKRRFRVEDRDSEDSNLEFVRCSVVCGDVSMPVVKQGLRGKIHQQREYAIHLNGDTSSIVKFFAFN